MSSHTDNNQEGKQMEMVMTPDPDAVLSTISNIPIDDTTRINAQLSAIPDKTAQTIYITMSEEISCGQILHRSEEEIRRYMIIFIKLGIDDGFGPDGKRCFTAYSGYLETGSLQSIAKFCTDEASEIRDIKERQRRNAEMDHNDRREFDIEIDTWGKLSTILNQKNHLAPRIS